MWQFLISGYVPGTDIQISFDTIAGIACMFLLILTLQYEMKRSRSVQRQILLTSKAVEGFRRSNLYS